MPQAGLSIYAFNGITYTNFSKVTNSAGQVVFTLPIGNYRFRSDKNGKQCWICTLLAADTFRPAEARAKAAI